MFTFHYSCSLHFNSRLTDEFSVKQHEGTECVNISFNHLFSLVVVVVLLRLKVKLSTVTWFYTVPSAVSLVGNDLIKYSKYFSSGNILVRVLSVRFVGLRNWFRGGEWKRARFCNFYISRTVQVCFKHWSVSRAQGFSLVTLTVTSLLQTSKEIVR